MTDKEAIKVPGVKNGLRFKNLYYNIENSQKKISTILRRVSSFLKMLLVSLKVIFT